MLATDAGMSMSVNELHPWKVHFSMLVTDVGMSILANEMQLANAFGPMLVTDEGMVTLDKITLRQACVFRRQSVR